MVERYSQYGGGGFGQKARDGVGKGAVGDNVVEWESSCQADLAGLERRSFLDGSTNRN